MRKLKISVSDPDSQWEEFSNVIFSNISFIIPAVFPNIVSGDTSAHFTYEFVSEEKFGSNYIKFGSDPFTKSFFHIRAQKISDDPKKILSLQKWCEKVKSQENPWCVFLFHERSLFGGPNLGTIPQLIPAERQFLVPFKSTLKYLDIPAESILVKFQKLVIESIFSYDSLIMDTINSESLPRHQIMKLKVWHQLLFFFYGFTETAKIGFKKIYTEYSSLPLIENYHAHIQKNNENSNQNMDEKRCMNENLNANENMNMNESCSDLGNRVIIPPIEPIWITEYPYLNDNDDDMSMFIFSLCGILASCYKQKDYKSLINHFMQNISILESKNINKLIVSNWVSQSLKALIDLGESFFDKDLIEQLLLQLFRVNLEIGNEKQIDEIYQMLTLHVNEKVYTRTIINVLYSKEKLFNDLTKNWSFGQIAAEKYFTEAITEQKYSKIRFFAKALLSDRSSKEVRIKVFNEVSSLDSEVVLDSPFFCKIKLGSDCFYKHVKIGYKFNVNIQLEFNKNKSTTDVFPEIFDSASLFFKHDVDTEVFYSTTVNINHIMFHCVFVKSGIWDFDRIEIQKGAIIFTWPINNDHRIYVDEYKKPSINATFPSLIGFCQAIPLIFSVDVSTIAQQSSTFKLSFDTNSLIVPDQNGISMKNKAKFEIVNSLLTFNINNNMTEENNSDQDNNIYNSEKIVSKIICKIIKPTDFAKLTVLVSVLSNDYEYSFDINFRCPIECHLRFLNEKFAHICLRNTATVPFIIESAEMQPSVWKRQTIEAGEVLFLLAQRSGNDVLKLFLKDESGSSIAMSWDINESIMRPMIEANFTKVPTAGMAFKVTINLPQCHFHIENSKDILVVGNNHINNFEGGVFGITFIPLRAGLLKMPTVSINHITYVIQPEYINVSQPVVTFISPFSNNE